MEDGSVATSSIPDVLPDTASLEMLKKYYEVSGHKADLDFDTIEVVEYDFVESGKVGADIRNKLSPPLNLVQLLEEYFINLVHTNEKREKLTEFIKKEMKQTLVSVDYLKKLF